ncbi:MAG: hypothetical protein OEV15_07585, partial [Gallionella sp.]|nr:hypothetical protein [Gallionella sp.]
MPGAVNIAATTPPVGVCMIEVSGAVTGDVPTQVPDVALIRTSVTATSTEAPPIITGIVAGTVATSPWLSPDVIANGLAVGVVIANAIPVAAVTLILWVADAVIAPVEVSHSAISTTVPAAVGVNVSGFAMPITSV